MAATGGDPFGDILKQTLELSKQVQADQESADATEPVVVERQDGRIEVTASPGGQIGLVIKPKAMHLGSVDLAIQIADAVNESLALLRERQGTAQALDLNAINEQAAEIQQQASRSLNQFMDGILRAHTAAGGETEPKKERP